MIGALNHIAIAVPNLDEAMEKYGGPLGAKVGKPKDLIEHGVTAVSYTHLTLPTNREV